MLLKEYNYLCKFNSIDKEKLKMACQQFPPSYLLSVRQQISVRDLSLCLSSKVQYLDQTRTCTETERVLRTLEVFQPFLPFMD